jgi:hypothetical protein
MGAVYSIFLWFFVSTGWAEQPTLHVESTPSGVWVFLEGERKGKTPLDIVLPPGYFRSPIFPTDKVLKEEYFIELAKEGYHTKRVKVTSGPFLWRGGPQNLIQINYFKVKRSVAVRLDANPQASPKPSPAPKPGPRAVPKPLPRPESRPTPKPAAAPLPGFPVTFIIEGELDVTGIDVNCLTSGYHKKLPIGPQVLFTDVPDEECRVLLVGNRPGSTVIRGGQTRRCYFDEDRYKTVCKLVE